jgi:cysteinyl-tRNA synthetase
VLTHPTRHDRVLIHHPASEAKESVYAVSRERDQVRQHAIAGDISDVLEDIIAQHNPAQQQGAATTPYVNVLSTFQSSLRDLAGKKAPAKDFLDLCDQLRDTHLWDLGIYLEDRENAPAMVRPVDAELQAARAQKDAIALQKAEAKVKRDEYSAWDADGLPTKDKEGADVAKGKVKKLRKEWEKQKKLFEEYVKGAGSS